jgi:hypothetical protein
VLLFENLSQAAFPEAFKVAHFFANLSMSQGGDTKRCSVEYSYVKQQGYQKRLSRELKQKLARSS